MNNPTQPASITEGEVERKNRPRWSMVVILLVAWLVIVLPFLFWKATWFGTRLSNTQIARYLANSKNPRQSQHALVQISDRLTRGDSTVSQFYPQVIALAESPVVELRMTAAWLMGQDNQYDPFHKTLLNLLRDPDPLVRWNAALALVRFNDTTGRPLLHEMLQPFRVVAPAAGVFKGRLKPGDAVNRGTLMARLIDSSGGDPIEIRSPIPGLIQLQWVNEGATLSNGSTVFTLLPAEKEVWEALRAFYLIGVPSDLPDIQPFTYPTPNMPSRIQQQAALTVDSIHKRVAGN